MTTEGQSTLEVLEVATETTLEIVLESGSDGLMASENCVSLVLYFLSSARIEISVQDELPVSREVLTAGTGDVLVATLSPGDNNLLLTLHNSFSLLRVIVVRLSHSDSML
jgi:hypothetical protein